MRLSKAKSGQLVKELLGALPTKVGPLNSVPPQTVKEMGKKDSNSDRKSVGSAQEVAEMDGRGFIDIGRGDKRVDADRETDNDASSNHATSIRQIMSKAET